MMMACCKVDETVACIIMLLIHDHTTSLITQLADRLADCLEY